MAVLHKEMNCAVYINAIMTLKNGGKAPELEGDLPSYALWKSQVVCLYVRIFEVISLKSLIAEETP